MPALNQPVRNYPLRPINEPAVFVVGDNIGHKVPLPIQHQGPADRQGMNTGFMGNPQAMLAQQNSNLEALERRNPRERGTGLTAVRPPLIFFPAHRAHIVVSARCLPHGWRMMTLQTSRT